MIWEIFLNFLFAKPSIYVDHSESIFAGLIGVNAEGLLFFSGNSTLSWMKCILELLLF